MSGDRRWRHRRGRGLGRRPARLRRRARRPRRSGRGHERPVPRPAALGRSLRGQGPARGRGVHRREPRSCGGSPPTASRTPAGSSSPRPCDDPAYADEFVEGCRDTGVDCEEIDPAQALREEPRLNPASLARVPRARRQHRGLEDGVGAGPRRPGARRRACCPTTRSSRIHRDGDQVTGARLRGRCHRRGDRHRGAGHGQRVRAPGPGRSPRWPASRASACSRAGGS